MDLSTAKANQKHKDNVFSAYFNEPKRLLSLYNALSDSDLPLETPVRIATLSNVLFHGRKNDIAFVIKGRLVVLLEHQSTINTNMPLRMLIYIARLYEKLIDNNVVYRPNLVKIPKPDFIVLYNGIGEQPDKQTFRLSDAFEDLPEAAGLGGSLELEVRVVNINEGRNEEIIRKCEALNGYVRFISKIRRNKDKGASLEEAVITAIRECVIEGIMADFLKENSSEVFNMLTLEFSLEEAKDAWQEEARREGRQEGRQEGVEIGMGTTLSIMRDLRNHNSAESVAERYRLPVDKVIEIQETMMLTFV